MPLVAHTNLPTFQRLRQEGNQILSPDYARHQDIRELHIGILNMMPDSALEATERQFMRLVGGSNHIAQFHVHLFTIDGAPRGQQGLDHISRYYEPFDKIQNEGLDALIVSGANVTQANLSDESFWRPLTQVFEWAKQNVTSILCSCLATHALTEYCYGLKRTHLGEKRWGVFPHYVMDRHHPLVADINTRFDVPHSRFNELFRKDFDCAGLKILVESEAAGVHLAVSSDLFRIVFFQGHPEYDIISLLKEYKREVYRYFYGERKDYPPYPENYFNEAAKRILAEYRQQIIDCKQRGFDIPEFPEAKIAPYIDTTWRDSAKAVFNNWLGRVYQITNKDRRLPFMEDIDPNDPLGLK